MCLRKLPLLLKCFHFISSRLYLFQAYVYDIRSSAYLHKFQKFTETVLNVTFNPATPEVRISFSVVLVWLAVKQGMCKVLQTTRPPFFFVNVQNYVLNGCLSTFRYHCVIQIMLNILRYVGLFWYHRFYYK